MNINLNLLLKVENEKVFELADFSHDKAIIQIIGFGNKGQLLCHYIEKKGVQGVKYFIQDKDKVLNIKYSVSFGSGNGCHIIDDSDLNIYLVDESELPKQIDKIQKYMEQTCLNSLVILNYTTIIDSGSEKVKKCIKKMNSFLPLSNRSYYDNNPQYLKSQNKSAYWYTRGISELVHGPGLICFDFAELHYVMSKMGKTIMGTFSATGKNRATDALEHIISVQPFNDVDLLKAHNILVILTAGMDITIREFENVNNTIMSFVSESAKVVVGTIINLDMIGEMRVTVIAGLNYYNLTTTTE